MSKRGISAVISALLLVVVVLSLAAVYFLWTRVILANTESGASAQKACENVRFAADDFCLATSSLFNSDGSTSEVKSLRFNVRNAAPNQNISGFRISLINNGGTSYLLSTLPASDINSAASAQIGSQWLSMSTSDISKLVIQPQINASGELISCESKGMEIPWGGVGTC